MTGRLTCRQARGIADEQIRHWRAVGLSPVVAWRELTRLPVPTVCNWELVRGFIAGWLLQRASPAWGD